MVVIPTWMEVSAPGAAEAARVISHGALSDPQHERLGRLTNDDTKRAWLEPRRRRRKDVKQLSETELWDAHHELMSEAYYAADHPPIGLPEIERLKEKLAQIQASLGSSAHNIWEIGNDVQLVGMWRKYRQNRPHDLPSRMLPDGLLLVATLLDRLSDFFQRAGQFYKPQGPVIPVGQPRDPDAAKTIVVRQIALVCRKHFGIPMRGTVAILANASLNRTDITRDTVRGSLRDPGVKS